MPAAHGKNYTHSPCGGHGSTLTVLLMVALLALSAAAPTDAAAETKVLLWLPVHASEPDYHVSATANCLFLRWSQPSVSGQSFDIVVTLAGGEEVADALPARTAALQAIIEASTRHLRPRPRVTSLPITLSTDAYDVDEARGRQSSFAGPNELFYAAMSGGRHDDDGRRPGARPNGMLPPPSSTTSLSALIAGYTFVQVIETDCCATTDGWLDALLQPMLDNPALLISGSRGRGACWTGAEYDGCTPTVDAAIPHAHLRDHINGNAMYRVGPDLARLVSSARDLHGSTVPFDVALHLAAGGSGDRAFDNGRAYSVMGLPVDEDRFDQAAYYGSVTAPSSVAFVHAPRRLRAPALQAVLRRLDTGRPVTVVVVPQKVEEESLLLLLRRLRTSLVRTRDARNTVYLVADEDAYAALARVVPMRMLMMMMASGSKVDAPSVLTSLASMARAGLATFTMGLDATVLQPYARHLMELVDRQPGTAWVLDGPAATLPAPALPGRLLFLPAGDQTAEFLEAWAAEETSISPQTLATRHHLSFAPLPPDLFPPASSFAGPLWTDQARRRVAAVVAWDGQEPSPATPAALSSAGLWRPVSSPLSSPPFTRCTNYSVLAAHPLPLTNPATIHRSLGARAAFERFVREKAIACVVLPGFRLATTGNVVPDVAVLGDGEGGLLGNTAVVFTSLADMEAAGKAGQSPGEFVHFEHVAHTAGTLSKRTKPARRREACSIFDLPTAGPSSSCFSPRLGSLIDAALATLPPSSYHCALDARRTHQEVALLSFEGRLGEVGKLVKQKGEARRRRLPIFLTGPWRHVAGGQLSGGALPKIVTLTDLTTPPSAPLDPMSRLVRFGIAPSSSLAASPWADVIEYAVCQGAPGGVFDLAEENDDDPTSPLALSSPSSLLARRAALIPPAVLAEDLITLNRWFARPDRPSLASAQRAQLAIDNSPPISSASDFQDTVLAPTLGLARAVGAGVAVLPALSVPWSTLVGEASMGAAHMDHASLVPGSVGVLLGAMLLPPARAASTNVTHLHVHPASADLVLHSPFHRGTVRALERALGARYHLATPASVQLSATASPAQHDRLKYFVGNAHSVVLS